MSKIEHNQINCIACKKPIKHTSFLQSNRPPKASDYNSCIRKCMNCRIGYSNSKKNPVPIFGNYQHNIPHHKILHQNLDYTLGNCLNVQNRTSKKIKFASYKSEDAITWSVFKYLDYTNLLHDNLCSLGLISFNDKIKDILLWGNINKKPSKEKLTSSEIGINFAQYFI